MSQAFKGNLHLTRNINKVLRSLNSMEKQIHEFKRDLKRALIPGPLKQYEKAEVSIPVVMKQIDEHASSIGVSQSVLMTELGVKNLYQAARRKKGKGVYISSHAYALAELYGKNILIKHEARFVFEEQLYKESRFE